MIGQISIAIAFIVLAIGIYLMVATFMKRNRAEPP